jgi:hypothetical protein
MSFLEQLGKGFIRSAVNQIGRDGGKVISNKIYRGAHSTPLHLGGKEVPDSYMLYEKQQKEYVLVKYFWACIISLIPIVGTAIVMWRAFANYFKKTKTVYKSESQSITVKDNRYRTGVRTQILQREIEVKVDADEQLKRKARLKSYGYFIIVLLGILYHIFVLR